MGWIILLVVVVVILISEKRKSDKSPTDRYDEGYRNGYQALRSEIQNALDTSRVDEESLRRIISQETPESYPMQTDSLSQVSMPVAADVNTSPVVSQATKPDKSVENMNTLLFVASLLFVAAGAAFIATSMPEIVKLIGVWLIVVVFYIAGMALHKSKKLKTAGVSFIGTSLAIIPFAGLALHQLTDLSAAVAWLITSIVGVGAYLFATLRLQSQVVAYLTMAFVVSLAASLSESVSLPLMWSFVLIIGVSLLASVVATVRPSWVPRVFSEPIERTGQLVTPLALLASLVLADKLSILSYEVIFGVATLHYLVAWLQSRQFIYETMTRVLLHITLLIFASDIIDDQVAFGITILTLAVLQQVYSIMVRRSASNSKATAVDKLWIVVMQVVQYMACAFWMSHDYGVELSVLAITIVGLASVAAIYRFADIRLAAFGLISSLLLPIVVARSLFDPALDWAVVASWFTIAAVVVLVARASSQIRQRSEIVKQFFNLSFAVYVVVAVLIALFIDELASGGLLVVLGLSVWAASYVMRLAKVSLLANVILVIATIQLLRPLNLDIEWLTLLTMWIVGGVFYAAHHLLVQRKDEDRATGLLGSVWVVLIPSALLMLTSTTDNISLLATMTVVFGAITIAVEGFRKRNKDLVEIAVYIASLAILRAVAILLPDLNMVFYAHALAAVVVLMAVWRRDFARRLMIAAGLVTFSSGIFALAEAGWYQLLFLVEHLALLVAGALTARRWAVWWGLVASCLAVLYFLKDLAFLAFAFLGLVIIGVVVWRLTRSSDKTTETKDINL